MADISRYFFLDSDILNLLRLRLHFERAAIANSIISLPFFDWCFFARIRFFFVGCEWFVSVREVQTLIDAGLMAYCVLFVFGALCL